MVYKQLNGCKLKKIKLMFPGLKGQRRLQLNNNENKLSATDNVILLGIEVGNKLKFNKRYYYLKICDLHVFLYSKFEVNAVDIKSLVRVSYHHSRCAF